MRTGGLTRLSLATSFYMSIPKKIPGVKIGLWQMANTINIEQQTNHYCLCNRDIPKFKNIKANVIDSPSFHMFSYKFHFLMILGSDLVSLHVYLGDYNPKCFTFFRLTIVNQLDASTLFSLDWQLWTNLVHPTLCEETLTSGSLVGIFMLLCWTSKIFLD